MIPAKCSICLGDIVNEKIILNCNHEFHFNCLTEWTRRRNNCPLCRRQTVNNQLIKYCHDYNNISIDNRLAYVINNTPILSNPILNLHNNIINISIEEKFILNNILGFMIDIPIINFNNMGDSYYLIINSNNHIIIGKRDLHNATKIKLVNTKFIYRRNGYINSAASKLININFDRDHIYKLKYR